MKKSLPLRIKSLPSLIGVYSAYLILFNFPLKPVDRLHNSFNFSLLFLVGIFFTLLLTIVILISIILGALLVVKGIELKQKKNIIAGSFLIGSYPLFYLLFICYLIFKSILTAIFMF